MTIIAKIAAIVLGNVLGLIFIVSSLAGQPAKLIRRHYKALDFQAPRKGLKK